MKEVNLNFDLTDLNGNTIIGVSNAGQIVANLLMTETKGEAVKYFDWAMALNNKKAITVDQADFTKIKTLIDTTDRLTLLAKAQIIKVLDSIK